MGCWGEGGRLRRGGYLQPVPGLFPAKNSRALPFSQQEATIEGPIWVYKFDAYDSVWTDQVTRMRRALLQAPPLGRRWLSSSALPEGWEAVTRKNGTAASWRIHGWPKH